MMNQTQKEMTATHTQSVVVEDFVFNSDFLLPQGTWELHITEGDAWIFSNDNDFFLHTNENVVISNTQGITRIKRLYSGGMVKFVAYPC